VICTRVNSDHFPPFYARTKEERDEQRRVLYVGLTRAEKRLVVTHYTEGKYGALSRSPFLRNVPRDAVVIHEAT
jgi:superfamily I DNA/RNA helicase